jgi:hypothetical protein
MGEPPATADASAGPALDKSARRLLRQEVLLVLALSLGASAVAAVIYFVGSLTESKALAQQTAVLVSSQAPGRPWLDLAWQLFGVVTALIPVALVAHLLARGGESLRTLGFDATQPVADLRRGAVVAAVIGGSGLALYLGARQVGVNLTVVPTNLPDVWWQYPVLVLIALQNALLEEVVVLGYLTHRLTQLGWSFAGTTLASSLLRGSYHLYQGLGGFLGNAVMGGIFCYLYRRWGRIMPLLIAHALIDMVAFVGFAALARHLSWIPG